MSRHQGPVLCAPCTTGVALAAHSVRTLTHQFLSSNPKFARAPRSPSQHHRSAFPSPSFHSSERGLLLITHDVLSLFNCGRKWFQNCHPPTRGTHVPASSAQHVRAAPLPPASQERPGHSFGSLVSVCFIWGVPQPGCFELSRIWEQQEIQILFQ